MIRAEVSTFEGLSIINLHSSLLKVVPAALFYPPELLALLKFKKIFESRQQGCFIQGYSPKDQQMFQNS